MIPKARLLLLIVTTLGFASGCITIRQADDGYEPPRPADPVYGAPTAGAIFNDGADVRLFEDRKAGRVGDILTVRLQERTNASKNSATSTSKATDVELANPVISGTNITTNGIPLFQGTLSGDSTFDGEGSSSQSNSLLGDITVTVSERLPNGNLRIRGEKWVTLNQGREFIRLSGIIRPDDIEPDNSLYSYRIADAQITYSSKGVLANANRMGFISRFFNSVFHPY